MDFKRYIRPGKTASDITPLLSNSKAFSFLIDTLASKFHGKRVDKVVCIEARGFLLGGAVAHKLQCGVIPLRKRGLLQNSTYMEVFRDYSMMRKH